MSHQLFSPTHPHYYGPATFNLLHYSVASVICSLIEPTFWSIFSFIFYNYQKETFPFWLALFAGAMLLSSLSTSILLIVGYYRNCDRYLQPKIVFTQILSKVLVTISVILILFMCLGLKATNAVGEVLINLPALETRLGPLWPLILTVIVFFTATVYIWMVVVYTNAADYYRDKDYFKRDQDQELK